MVSAVASLARAAPVDDFSRSRANQSAVRAGIGSGLGSIRPSTPSRANTKPARARRERWARAKITGRSLLQPSSQPPARMQRHDAAGHALEADAAEAGAAHHVGERLRVREAADRFDQVAVGFAVAGYDAPERRDHVERIEVVERIKPRHVDRREFEAKEAPADPAHAKRLFQRNVN